MTVDTEELKRLAEATTPGPWKHYTQTHGGLTVVGAGPTTLETDVAVCDSRGLTKAQNANNGAFIAAANPAVILALLERVRRLEEALNAHIATHGCQSHDDCSVCHDAVRALEP